MPFVQNRRTFLKQSLGAALGVAAARVPAAAQGRTPRFRISLAEWSFHRALRSKQMQHLDFAKRAREEFGLEAVEYVNQFFMDKAEDKAYIADMKTRADDQNVRSLLIMCDSEGALGDPDEAARRKAVENHYKWVTAAKALGCHSIRVNAQSSGTWDEQKKRAADGLHRLSEFGDQHGINVIVENHGGLSSNGEWLSSVIKEAKHPRCGTLPDFGNFQIKAGEEYDRYKGVRELMPFAKGVSAKSHDFDAQGNETHTDYGRMLDIVLGAGYNGFIGIEYEGDSLGEAEGVAATKKLLERYQYAT
jgi:L-ribulose-5-phosphate 3-epimerase